MSKLEQKLKEIKKRNRIGLMTHLVIGYPSLEKTVSLIRKMADAGADIIELQIPFSDPVADGPTIMHACEKSLERGTKVKDAFIVMKTLSSSVPIPLLFMAYYNTAFKYGTERFCKDAKKAGADGLIVPDMPIDEEQREHFFRSCRNYDLHNIRVMSPASTDERLQKNMPVANGFIYCASHQGITGAEKKLDRHLAGYLKKIRRHTSIPIAVGFGISSRQHVDALQNHADIAIIGSALIDIFDQSKKNEAERNVAQFIRSCISE